MIEVPFSLPDTHKINPVAPTLRDGSACFLPEPAVNRALLLIFNGYADVAGKSCVYGFDTFPLQYDILLNRGSA